VYSICQGITNSDTIMEIGAKSNPVLDPLLIAEAEIDRLTRAYAN